VIKQAAVRPALLCSDAPTRYPVRFRIQTNDPVLAELPWTQVCWDNHRLWDAGWTFELKIGETSPSHFHEIRLQAPSQVLLIASQPDNAINLCFCDSHLHALEERLDHAWPAAHRPPLPSVETWEQLEKTCEKYMPDIIYFYGLAKGNGEVVPAIEG